MNHNSSHISKHISLNVRVSEFLDYYKRDLCFSVYNDFSMTEEYISLIIEVFNIEKIKVLDEISKLLKHMSQELYGSLKFEDISEYVGKEFKYTLTYSDHVDVHSLIESLEKYDLSIKTVSKFNL